MMLTTWIILVRSLLTFQTLQLVRRQLAAVPVALEVSDNSERQSQVSLTEVLCHGTEPSADTGVAKLITTG